MECLQDIRLQWFDLWKEWKRVLGLVNVEPSRLAVVTPEDDQGKHEMR